MKNFKVLRITGLLLVGAGVVGLFLLLFGLPPMAGLFERHPLGMTALFIFLTTAGFSLELTARSFRWKDWAARWALLAAVLSPLALVAVSSLKQTEKGLTHLAFSQRSSLARLAAMTLKERFDRITDLSVSLSTRVQFRKLVAEGNWEEAKEILAGVPKNFPFVDRILLTDTLGVLMADLPESPEVKKKSFAFRDWYRGVMEARRTYVSEVYQRTAPPRIHVVAVATPILDERQNLSGIMVLQIGAETFFQWGQDVQVGLGGYAYFVDGKGHAIGLPEIHSSEGVTDYRSVPSVQKLLRGERGIEVQFNPVANEERLSAFEPVAGYDWGVVVQQPTRTAFAERNESLRRMTVVYGFILLFGCLCAYLVLRALAVRKRSEEALRDSERRYRLLFDQNPMPAWVFDLDTLGFLAVNEAAVRHYGYSREEFLSMTIKDIRPAEDVPFLMQRLSKGADGEGVSKEWRHRKRDGTVISVEIDSHPLIFAGKQAELVLANDITERKRAEEERDKFFTLSLDMLCIAGFDGYFKRLNPIWEKTLGYTIDELKAKPFIEFIHPDDREATTAEAQKLATGVNVISFENRYLCKNGSYRWLLWSSTPSIGNQLIYAAARDVTERKRAEEALRNSEEKYRTLFDSIDVGVCTIEVLFDGNDKPVDYRFLEVNSSFEKQTGIQNAPGRRMREIAPLHEEHWFEIYGKIALTGEPARFENQATQLHRWYDVYAFRVGEPEKRQVAIHFKDITGRKQVESELKKLHEDLKMHAIQLEAANKELEAFSYSVSHDLRAPLRSIDGFSQALLEDYADKIDGEGKSYLQRVRAATQRMGQLIDDMLNLSRVTRSEMRRQPVNLSGLARNMAEELQKREPQRNVEFVIAEGLAANADERLLRVVLENLLGNAWKYTSKHAQARIEFGATYANGEPAYFVRDDGAGFDMAYAGKLFGAFQRLHGMTEFEGTGVGLATVARIIHRHGGRVWAEAAVEKGAAFYFTIPGSSAPAANPEIQTEKRRSA